MADIGILPLSELGKLFDAATTAEGLASWYEVLARTTLEQGEVPVCAAIWDERGVAKAALPLVRTGRQGLRALTAPYTTQYAPAFPDLIWARLLGMRAREYVSGSLHIDALDQDDAAVAAFLEGLSCSGLTSVTYRHFLNRFEAVGSFEEYWQKRPSRLRTTVRRKSAQAQKAGALQFQCVREHEALADAIIAYENVQRASWKEPEPHPAFMSAMVERLAGNDAVRIALMSLGGEVIAAQIWLVWQGKATIFKLVHREDAVRYSPGSLLTHWMIETICRGESIHEIDFGRGDDPYKCDWLTASRWRSGVIAANCRSLAGLGVALREVWPSRGARMGRQAFDFARRLRNGAGPSGDG